MADRGIRGEIQHTWREGPQGSERPSSHEGRSVRGPSGEFSRPTRRSGTRSLGKAVAIACSLIISGTLIFVLVFMPGCTSTALVVASVDRNEDCKLPPSSFGKRDTDAITQAGSRIYGTTVRDIHSDTKFAAELGQLARQRSKSRLIVVYLSAHAGYFAEGGTEQSKPVAGLFWADASVDEPPNKPTAPRPIYTLNNLRDLLSAVPKQQHVLLIMDMGEMQPDWRTGMLGNWFYDQVPELVKDIPNLTVISSCAPGERSFGGVQSSGEAGSKSAFGCFVAQALQGGDWKNERGVKVNDFFNFVRDNTNRWVYQNRDSTGQHPRLFPPNRTFDPTTYISLTQKPSRSPMPAATSAADEPEATKSPSPALAWGELDALWQDREKLKGDPPDVIGSTAAYQYDPIGWRALTHCLLTAEQFRRDNAADEARDPISQARQLVRRLQDTAASDPLLHARKQASDKASFATDYVLANRLSAMETELPKTLAPFNGVSPDALFNKAAKEQKISYQDVVDQGVELRRLSEWAACGQPGTQLTSAKLIAAAENLRHLTEDKIFLQQDFDAIRRDQARVKQLYELAILLQKTHYKLRCLRNRLLAELPEMAVWAAFRAPRVNSDRHRVVVDLFQATLKETPPRLPNVQQLKTVLVDSSSAENLDDLNLRLLILFRLNRDFERKLKSLPDGKFESEADLTKFAANLHGFVKESDQEIEEAKECFTRIDQTIGKRVETRGDLKSQLYVAKWQDEAELLAFPELPFDVRKSLNDVLAKHSRKLQQDTNLKAVAKVPQEPADDRRAAQARWHALWAIQVLSDEAYGTQEAQSPLWALWSQLPEDHAGEFVTQIVQLGDGIRRKFVDHRSRLEQLSLRRDAELQANTDEQAPDEWLLQSDGADRSARNYLDRCAALEFAGKLNPAETWRRGQAQYHLLALARQYLDDYWNDWYQAGVQGCLDSARNLAIKQFRGMSDDLDLAFQKRKAASADLEGPGLKGTQLAFRSEDRLGLPVKVLTHDLPAGLATFSLDIPGIITEGGISRRSVDLNVASDQRPSLDFTLLRQNAAEAAANASPPVARIFFRGHLWNEKLQIDTRRPTGVQVIHTVVAPRDGSVIVEGQENPIIQFVLDCSKSMDAPVNPRFPKAIGALNASLAVLLQRQAPCSVGLMRYGTFPTGVQDIVQLNPIAKLTPAYRSTISTALQNIAIKDMSGTPLFNSVESAINQLAGAPGTIVVITDGVDNGNMAANVFAQLMGNINAAKKGDVTVIMIGVDIDSQLADSIDKKLQANAQVAAKLTAGQKLTDGDFASANLVKDELAYARMTRLIADRFIPASSVDGLEEVLKAAVAEPTYAVVADDPSQLDFARQERILGKPVDQLHPGTYRAQLGSAASFTFQITDGDAIRLRANANRLIPIRPRVNKGVVEATVRPPYWLGYQNFNVKDVGQDSEAVFKLSLTSDDLNAGVPHPAEIDFTVFPQGTNSPRSMTWNNLANEAVPTWRIVVPKWPGRKAAEIQARWKLARTKPDRSYSWSDFQGSVGKELDFSFREGAVLKLLQAEFDQQRDTVVLAVQIKDFDIDSPGAENRPDVHDLRQTRFEIQSADAETETIRPRTTRSLLYPAEGKLIVEIEVPGEKSLNGWNVLLTSRNSLRQGAEEVKSLVITTVDEEL